MMAQSVKLVDLPRTRDCVRLATVRLYVHLAKPSGGDILLPGEVANTVKKWGKLVESEVTRPERAEWSKLDDILFRIWALSTDEAVELYLRLSLKEEQARASTA